jgi:hypothetical protein
VVLVIVLVVLVPVAVVVVLVTVVVVSVVVLTVVVVELIVVVVLQCYINYDSNGKKKITIATEKKEYLRGVVAEFMVSAYGRVPCLQYFDVIRVVSRQNSWYAMWIAHMHPPAADFGFNSTPRAQIIERLTRLLLCC